MLRGAVALAIASLSSTAALARSEDRDLPEFSAVSVAAGIRASVEIGPRRPVHVEAEDDVLPLVETRVEDGALHVGFKPDTRLSGEHRVSVNIQTPQLHAVDASGGAAVRATFTPADESAIHASGGSEVRIRSVDATRLLVQGSGGSELEMQGSADRLDLETSGGTRLHGRDLALKDVDVHASGGSEGEVRASGTVRGSLSGGCELHVRGRARANVATTGGSSVEVED